MKITDIRLAILCGCLLAGVAGTANGQYAWIDEKGRKQFSDMPPPASVPANRILAHPRAPTTTQASPTPAPDAAKPSSGYADKDAEFRKRRMEQAEKEKELTEKARLAAEEKKNCERARDYKTNLESGARIARIDKNGERSFLEEDEIAQELQEAKRRLEACK